MTTPAVGSGTWFSKNGVRTGETWGAGLGIVGVFFKAKKETKSVC